MPGNRAIAYGADHRLRRVLVSQAGRRTASARPGERLVVARSRWAAARAASSISRPTWSWCCKASDSPARSAAIRLHGRGYDFDVPLLAGDFVTDRRRHRLRPHRARPWRGRFRSGPRARPRGAGNGRRLTAPITRRCRCSPGKHVYRPNGKEGDANQAVIAAHPGSGRAAGRRQAGPFLPAFLALQGAADLPRHAAMVHPHGDERLARHGAGGDRRDALDSAARPEPHPRHDRDPARLVHLAPARLGRADRGVRRQEDRRAAARPGRGRPHRAPSSEGADAWFTRRSARFLGNDRDPADYEQVKDIVDVWFESGSTHAFVLEARQDLPMAGLALSRRLGPASRLVPFLAAGILRHARARAVQGGADPRLRPGRAGPQDVEVAGQRRLAPGGGGQKRRRHPAAVGGRRRIMPRICASARKS